MCMCTVPVIPWLPLRDEDNVRTVCCEVETLLSNSSISLNKSCHNKNYVWITISINVIITI